MSADAAPRAQRLAPDVRREQILAAAHRLLAERPLAELSTAAIAREAGVARGLIHHYFGGRRELYLELVSTMLRMPPQPPAIQDDRPVDQIVGEAIDRWLVMVERHRGTWLASVGARGLASDPEVEQILEDAREQAALNFLAMARRPATPRWRATVRAFSAFAEETTIEWLARERLTRDQVHQLLTSTLVHLTAGDQP